MQCTQFEERFHAALDQRQRPQEDTTLLAHAAACATCRTLLDGEETLFHGLGAMHRTEPGFTAALSPVVVIPENGSITTRSGAKQRFPMRRTAAMAVLTASIALVALLLRLDPVQTPTAARLDPRAMQAARLADVSHLRSAAEAKTKPGVSDGALSDVLDRWAVLASSEITAQLEYSPTANSLLQFTDHFRPLADPFVVLFDVLRRSFGWPTPMQVHPGAT